MSKIVFVIFVPCVCAINWLLQKGIFRRSFGFGLILLEMLGFLAALASFRVPSSTFCLLLAPVTVGGKSSLSSIAELEGIGRLVVSAE